MLLLFQFTGFDPAGRCGGFSNSLVSDFKNYSQVLRQWSL